MPAKEFRLSDELTIKVYKRRTNRSLRLSITPAGQVRVTIPAWAPYRAGYEFAKSRQAWIEEQRTVPNRLNNGQAIGKAHRLKLIPTANAKRISSRLLANTVVVKYPQHLSETSQSVQSAAQTSARGDPGRDRLGHCGARPGRRSAATGPAEGQGPRATRHVWLTGSARGGMPDLGINGSEVA